MDSLLNKISDSDPPHSSPFKTTSTLLTSNSVLNRELSAQEEKLSRVLIDRVLPPFSKSMKLQALVVYQADREKMNCLLVNRTFEKHDSVSRCLEAALLEQPGGHTEETSDLSDSGYLESTALTSIRDASPEPLMNGIAESCMSTESVDLSQSISRRKRKLCRPCKIPQNGPPLPFESCTSSKPEVEVKISKVTTSATTTPLITVTQHSGTLIATSNEVIPFTPKSISDSLLLPVTAVTLLPRVSVFSLPVTVLSTVPRPILPRLTSNSHDKFSAPIITNSSQSTSVVFSSTTGSVKVTNSHATNRTTETLLKSEPNRAPVITIPVGIDSSDSALNRRFGKSFLCNQCRRDFSSLSQLCAHTFAVHRSFRCTICGAQFTQRSNLQRHSLRHVGFKPFICKVCDKAYYRKDHLVRHIEISHPGRDPRLSLTVKLSSAECLDYLERLQSDNKMVMEPAQLLNERNVGASSPIRHNGSPEEAKLVIEPMEEDA